MTDAIRKQIREAFSAEIDARQEGRFLFDRYKTRAEIARRERLDLLQPLLAILEEEVVAKLEQLFNDSKPENRPVVVFKYCDRWGAPAREPLEKTYEQVRIDWAYPLWPILRG